MGKVAVITGASTGIGRATAHEFARQGYSLATLARRKELLDELNEELSKGYPNQRFVGYKCDVRKWEEVAAVAKAVLNDFDAVEALVNNAGAFEYLSLEKSTPEKLDEMIDVNLRGVVYVTKAFLPLLKNSVAAKRPAKIVNVSSIAGLWGFSNMSVYTATKFAVVGFTSGLRRELRAQGIQVATIHPGPVRSKAIPGKAVLNKKRLEMLPDQIGRQIFRLAVNSKRRRVSHPAFSIFNAIERFSPAAVDRLLKRFL
jgi:3-hydroxy acid dehydrogenase/malonic semialdehyde reductase